MRTRMPIFTSVIAVLLSVPVVDMYRQLRRVLITKYSNNLY